MRIKEKSGPDALETAVKSLVDAHDEGVELSCLEIHLEYAEHGVLTIPVDMSTKKPLIRTGRDHLEGATCDPDVIRGWHGRWPDLGIGLPTGVANGVVVIDLDVRPGKDGKRNFRALAESHGGARATLAASTPSHGRHFFYKHPGERTRVKSVTELGACAGIDVRGDGGFVILYPSYSPKHQASYSWLRLSEGKLPKLRDLPPWILDMIDTPPRRPVGEDKIVEGSRNDSLFRKVAGFFREGMSRDAVAERILEINRDQVSPPLPEDEVLKIVNSAASYRVQGHAPDGIRGSDLLRETFEPPVFIAEELVPQGLTLVVGKAKVGKSHLALDLGVAVATGSEFIGAFACVKGSVLYLALEDTKARMQGRMRTALEGLNPSFFDDLHIFFDWPQLNNGGLARIEKWVAENPDTKLVVVDILERIRPPRVNNGSIYEADYKALVGLKEVADRFGLGIAVVHHARKQASQDDPFDVASGSMGITGAADTTMILGRTKTGTELYIRGRDVEERKLALAFDKETGRWSSLGNADEVRRSTERTRILDALRSDQEPLGPQELAASTGMSYEGVRSLLGKMMRDGEVTKLERGKYSAAP